MFQIEGYDYEFRIKEINAIEILALKTQLNFKNSKEAKNFFDEILERIEVKAGNDWLPCNNNGVYYPVGLDKDTHLTDEVIGYFMNNVIMPVFPKSSESNE